MKLARTGELLRRVYVGNFFYGLHYAIIVYVLSTFISGFVGKTYLGFIYATIAFISIFISFKLPVIIRKLGHFALVITLLLLTIGSSILLTLSPAAPLALVLVTLYSVTEFLLYIVFDLYVEKLSDDNKTGNIRGVYLTMYNLAFVAGPLIAAAAIGNNNYAAVFAVGAATLVPTLLIYLTGLREVKGAMPKTHNWKAAIGGIRKDCDIRKIFLSTFLLEFFYTWMVIYAPLYLLQNIGFTWGDIGVIFTVMLTPFVLLQIPMGLLADKYLGEKEILTCGFIISAISTAAIAFVSSQSIVVFAALFFLTRVGASLIEVMNDTYFFKHVNEKNADVIALFRNGRQVNYIIAPILAAVVMFFFPMWTLFIILGVVMLLGAFNASTLRDTK